MTESTTAGPRPAEPGPATQDIAVRPSQLSVPGDLVELRRRNLATRWPEKETVTERNQFVRFRRGETTFDRATRHRSVGAALRLIAGAGRPERRGT
jgi:hypothetical protein